MAEKYQVRKFEPVNNSSYQFFEVAVNGKFQFQEFVDNLKDEQRNLKKLNAIYGYMDSLSPSNLLPKTKFRSIKCKKCKNVYEFKKNDIRVYVILERPDVFVILGAYKSNQDLDIKKIDKLFNGFEM